MSVPIESENSAAAGWIDVTLATEGDRRGAADESVLDLATRRQRVLITQDADFLRLHQEGRSHAGVVYYAPGSRTVGELISRLVLLHGVLQRADAPGYASRGS